MLDTHASQYVDSHLTRLFSGTFKVKRKNLASAQPRHSISSHNAVVPNEPLIPGRNYWRVHYGPIMTKV